MDLLATLLKSPARTMVSVTVLRNGSSKKLTVTLRAGQHR